MATVGWSLYKLAFDVLSVPGPEAALAAIPWAGEQGEQGDSLALLAEGARLWLPASLGRKCRLGSATAPTPVSYTGLLGSELGNCCQAASTVAECSLPTPGPRTPSVWACGSPPGGRRTPPSSPSLRYSSPSRHTPCASRAAPRSPRPARATGSWRRPRARLALL